MHALITCCSPSTVFLPVIVVKVRLLVKVRLFYNLGPSYKNPLGYFFLPALLLSIFALLLPSSSVHASCSHAQVFGKTLVHVFHIPCSQTEWHLLTLLWQMDKICKQSSVRLCKFVCSVRLFS